MQGSTAGGTEIHVAGAGFAYVTQALWHWLNSPFEEKNSKTGQVEVLRKEFKLSFSGPDHGRCREDPQRDVPCSDHGCVQHQKPSGRSLSVESLATSSSR